MKKTTTYAIALMAALLTSCYSPSATEEEEIVADSQSKAVMFVMKGIEVDYASRATIASEGMTDLWVWEGTTLLKHQTSADADFGTPTIALKYGSHDLTFLASKAAGQTLTDGVWICTTSGDTYASAMNVTVSTGSGTSRQVELKRLNTKLMWTIEDAIPASAKTLYIKITNYCMGATAALEGAQKQTYEKTVANIAGYRGSTNVPFTCLFIPETYGEECDVEATIKICAEDGTVLCNHTKTVQMKTNRVTNLHGTFFGQDGANTVSLTTTWEEQHNVAL